MAMRPPFPSRAGCPIAALTQRGRAAGEALPALHVAGRQWTLGAERGRAGGLLLVALATCSAVRGGAFTAARASTQPPLMVQVLGSTPRSRALAAAASPRSPCTLRIPRAAAAKELDDDAVLKYISAVALQVALIAAFFQGLDLAVTSAGSQPPDWAVFGLFFGMSLRSRIFSPLDNSRPDLGKATRGESTGGFNDRVMPGWTPPGIFFPIMWGLIVAPLRAASSLLVWQQVGHFCDLTILALMLHLCIGDTWNTINNVERRLGAAVPGVLCVWASALFAAYTYYGAVPTAGQLLIPPCLWITVAAALITDTWRINNPGGDEPLFPYKGATRTQYWFLRE